MLKPFLTLAGLFIGCLSAIYAQDFDNYQPLENTGTIPEEFITPSSQKYKTAIESIEAKEKARTQKDYKDFYLESNFIIDDLLQSTRVLFNDPLTDYINKVADELLKDDPEMRKKLRFYAVRSSAVNAFATNQGIIFVNVGLLAQLESEAQLAFILAHEITHVRHGHALDMFLESQKIDRYTRRTDLVKNTSFDDRLVAKNFYSKELETHADKEGLELYLKSNYSLKDLDGVFDVLQYAYLPFDLEPFTRDFFENEFISLPDEYFLPEEDLNGIDGEYEEDESKSTHPSVEKRRETCANTIAKLSNDNRQRFVIGDQAKFNTIRDIARFELVYYYLHQFRYQEAIYACYILQKKYPNSSYLKKIIAQSLYGYAKFKNELKGIKPYSVTYIDDDLNTDNMGSRAHEDIEGPSQQVYYSLAQMSAKETTVLALRYVWDAVKVLPNDPELLRIQDDLFLEFNYHYKSLKKFATAEKGEEVSTTNTAEATTEKQSEEALSKYDKIKKQKKTKEKAEAEEEEEYDFTIYAFSDVVEDKTFQQLFEKGKKEKERRETVSEYYNSSEGRAYLRRRRKKRSVALDIDSVLVYTPYYARVRGSSSPKVDYLTSETNQKQLVDLIQKNAKIAKVHTTLLNVHDAQTSDVALLNDLHTISEWLSQQNRFGSNLLMPSFNQAKADQLIKKYGTRYLLSTGVVSLKRNKTHWIYWATLFDLKTGRYTVIKEDYYRQPDTRTNLNAHIFDAFFQIKSKRKEKK